MCLDRRRCGMGPGVTASMSCFLSGSLVVIIFFPWTAIWLRCSLFSTWGTRIWRYFVAIPFIIYFPSRLNMHIQLISPRFWLLVKWTYIDYYVVFWDRPCHAFKSYVYLPHPTVYVLTHIWCLSYMRGRIISHDEHYYECIVIS